MTARVLTLTWEAWDRLRSRRRQADATPLRRSLVGGSGTAVFLCPNCDAAIETRRCVKCGYFDESLGVSPP